MTIWPNSFKEFGFLSLHSFQNEYTVLCAQRPFPCEKAWQADSIGNGIFYGHVTDINLYKNDLKRLDVAIIQIRTNEEIIKLLEKECTENGTTLQEALQYTTLSQLADDLGYCFIE